MFVRKFQNEKIRVQVWAVVLPFYALVSSCSEFPNGCPFPVPKLLLRTRLCMGCCIPAVGNLFHGRNAHTVRASIRPFGYQYTLQTVFYHNSGNGAFYCLSQI